MRLAPFDVRADGRVGLPALHFLERAEVGVLVVQADHEAQRDLVVLQVVEEAAAEGGVVHRPAGGVHHQAGLGLGRVDLPQLLDADGKALRVLVGIQPVLGDQLLAQVAARALGEHRVLAQQLHAELEVRAGLAVLLDAQVAGGHPAHAPLLVIQHLGGREAGEDLHAQCLGLLRHPAHHVAQRDDVAAVVVEVARHQPDGQAARAGFGQRQHLVAGDRLVQRRAQFLPVREQLVHRARVHHRAGEDVRAGLGTLLEHAHGDLLTPFGGDLLQPDGGREPGRAGAHDHDVVLHRLARTVLFQDLLWGHGLIPLMSFDAAAPGEPGGDRAILSACHGETHDRSLGAGRQCAGTLAGPVAPG